MKTMAIFRTDGMIAACCLWLLAGASQGATPVQANVDYDAIIRTLDATMFGVNTAIWDGTLDTAGSIALLREAGPTALRFPGGSIADQYHWASDSGAPKPAHWVTSFQNFMHVARQTGAQAVITVNYGSGTPEEAAAWVSCANVTNHCHFQYWEIGNENYGAWERDDNMPAHDPVEYARRARDYSTQMRAADPTIKIGVPVAERIWRMPDRWTPPLLSALAEEGVRPDFLVYHFYPEPPGRENDATLLQAASEWPGKAAYLRQELQQRYGSGSAGIDLFCTENNSIPLRPGKQSTSLVNGLFLADSFGEIAQTEFKAFFWWNWCNGGYIGPEDRTNNNSVLLHGWRNYGDYAMLSKGPYPTFYTFKLLKWFARPGDRVVRASSNSKLLAVYAVRQANGSLALLVINKSPVETLAANISVAHFQAGPAGVAYEYGMPQDDAARTGAGPQDVVRTVFKTAGPPLERLFAPYSATVVVLPPRLLN